MSTSDSSTKVFRTRKKTFAEIQPYLFGYGAGISTVSPVATVYQLCRLNPSVANTTFSRMMSMSAMVFLPQTILKAVQMNISTPVKENLNPWAAFACIGILQGGVYGQANMYFSQQLKLGKEFKLIGMFRGVGFAALRDMISQGIPFVYSKTMRYVVFDRLLPDGEMNSSYLPHIKHWSSVLFTSAIATVMSQGLHNCQLMMQSNQELTYLTTLQTVWKNNGIATFYRGAEARIGLLLVVNVLNELLLKPAWAPLIEEVES